jgi:hypothetical protein
MSRPAGREAFLMARSYIFNSLNGDDAIILDFAAVKVLAPSWIDEFITGIKTTYKNPVQYINSENASVNASLKVVDEAI